MAVGAHIACAHVCVCMDMDGNEEQYNSQNLILLSKMMHSSMRRWLWYQFQFLGSCCCQPVVILLHFYYGILRAGSIECQNIGLI